MGYNIIVQDEATVAMQEAYEWYENKREGLGDELILEFENCLLKLSDSPQHYSYLNDSKIYRRIKVSRFPYIIVYEIIDGDVIIIDARNTWMKPIY